MAKTFKRVFSLSDGTADLRLLWHTSRALPDFAGGSIVSARVGDSGYEWATAETTCLNCGCRFPISHDSQTEGSSRSGFINDEVLNDDAIPLLMMLGNVSIDISHMMARCPECAATFEVKPKAREEELLVSVDDYAISLRCPNGKTVYFLPDGKVLASERQLRGTPAAEAVEFSALPGEIGCSQEGKDWLCWALGIHERDRLAGNEIDVLDLALRYRFKNYGDAFIDEVKASITQSETRPTVLNGLFALPRNSSDLTSLERMFRKSHLPDKPSVRKAAMARPAALAIAAKMGLSSICGNDPNLAVTLLSSKRLDAVWASAMLGRKGGMSSLLTLAIREEKPSYLIQRLLALDAANLSRGVRAFEELNLDPYEELKAYRLARKNHSLSDILQKPKLLAAYAMSDEDINITYGAKSSLQGEYDGYRFSLPRNTSRFSSAGATLKNCLGEGYAANAALGKTLVFLVSKDKRLVGAVEVFPESNNVCQMYAKANRPIMPDESLGIAISQWAKDKGIGLSEANYGSC